MVGWLIPGKLFDQTPSKPSEGVLRRDSTGRFTAAEQQPYSREISGVVVPGEVGILLMFALF